MRGQTPEPRVVAEPSVQMSGVIVVEKDEDVWVEHVAKRLVAKSRVAVEVDIPEMAMVRLPKGERGKVDGGEWSAAEESGWRLWRRE